MTTTTADPAIARDDDRDLPREDEVGVARDPGRDEVCEPAIARDREGCESHADQGIASANRAAPARLPARADANGKLAVPDPGDPAMLAPQPRHAARFPAATPATIAPARSADEVPAAVAWLGVIGVALPSLLALAWFQHRLYMIAAPGLPEPLAWGLAIGLDWGSIVAGVFWLRGSGELRTWGRAATVALVLGSTALMCWSWWLMSGPGWAALGLIPAVVVFAMTKLLTLWQGQRAGNRSVLADAAAQVAAAEVRARAAEALADEIQADADVERAALLARVEAMEARLSAAPADRVSVEDTGPLPVTPSERGRVSHIADRAGQSKSERAEAIFLAAWERGEEPSGAEVDAMVGGKSTGRAVLAKLRKRGELPPSERESAAVTA